MFRSGNDAAGDIAAAGQPPRAMLDIIEKQIEYLEGKANQIVPAVNESTVLRNSR